MAALSPSQKALRRLQGARAEKDRLRPPPSPRADRRARGRAQVEEAVQKVLEVFPEAEVLSSREITEAVSRWSEDAREAFEERAAIVEHDGGETRERAEQLAFLWNREKAHKRK